MTPSVDDPQSTPQLDDAARRAIARARAKAMINRVVGENSGTSNAAPILVRESIERLGTASTKDVQQIVASQLELLTACHQVALGQSNRSFFWALIGSGAGLLLFVVAVGFSLLTGLSQASIVPLIAGAVVEVVSGVVFYLYGQTSLQLSAFHGRLEVLQRYLLANSICEGLSEAERDKARAGLIGEISRGQPTTTGPVTLSRCVDQAECDEIMARMREIEILPTRTAK
jgi:hypothetical protein